MSGLGTDTFEPNDKYVDAKELLLNESGSASVESYISYPTDFDFYKINIGVDSSATVSLKDLPADFDIVIFDDFNKGVSMGEKFTQFQNSEEINASGELVAAGNLQEIGDLLDIGNLMEIGDLLKIGDLLDIGNLQEIIVPSFSNSQHFLNLWFPRRSCRP